MYTIIKQVVNQEGVDEVYHEKSFNKLEDCNKYLENLHSKYYNIYDTKLLRNESLFLYHWNGTIYTERIYYKII